MGATSYGSLLEIDVAALREAAAVMRSTIPAAHAAAKVALAEGGEMVAKTAASNASYSDRIPGSLRVSVSGTLVVRVYAGGDAATDAAAIENRGKGFVRHPTFGRRGPGQFTDKNSKPAFLEPAGESDKAAIFALYETVTGDAIRGVLDRGDW